MHVLAWDVRGHDGDGGDRGEVELKALPARLWGCGEPPRSRAHGQKHLLGKPVEFAFAGFLQQEVTHQRLFILGIASDIACAQELDGNVAEVNRVCRPRREGQDKEREDEGLR